MSQALCASQEAIEFHYDVGNDFFSLWLDRSLTYSCALFGESTRSLEDAQQAKLDFHIRNAGARYAERVLDIGCGWGSTLRRVTEHAGARHATGLTLSRAQKQHVDSQGWAGVRVELESWEDHRVDEPYDAIISIGAFEHFARPEHTPEEKTAIYRSFFERCHDLLAVGGRLSLQTIGFGRGRYIPGTPLAAIFPESHLPRLNELTEAADGLFEITVMRNDRHDYARTCREWARRLVARRDEAERVTSVETVRDYIQSLEFVAWGFETGVFTLWRLAMHADPFPRRKR